MESHGHDRLTVLSSYAITLRLFFSCTYRKYSNERRGTKHLLWMICNWLERKSKIISTATYDVSNPWLVLNRRLLCGCHQQAKIALLVSQNWSKFLSTYMCIFISRKRIQVSRNDYDMIAFVDIDCLRNVTSLSHRINLITGTVHSGTLTAHPVDDSVLYPYVALLK